MSSRMDRTFNEFEGLGGNDIITGNGLTGLAATRLSYVSATAGVTVDLAAGIASGDASVGTDTITGGVNRVRGSNFNDTLSGDANDNTSRARTATTYSMAVAATTRLWAEAVPTSLMVALALIGRFTPTRQVQSTLILWPVR